MMVEVSVARLGLDSSNNSYVVILRERGGRRLLPIWIGQAEAESIALQLNNQKPARPLTHDLCKSLIGSLGGSLERVNITRVHNSTYYAELLIRAADGVIHVDARPSDSIAIALRCEAPIFAPETFLTAIEADEDEDEDASGESGEEFKLTTQATDEMTAEQLKEYLARLRPEDFGKFTP